MTRSARGVAGAVATLAVSLVLLAWSPATRGDTLEVAIHPTTGTPAVRETTPNIGFDGISHVVVYTSGAAGTGDIFYRRITDQGVAMGSPEPISSSETDDRLNDLYGSFIIYTALDPEDATRGIIKLYDIRTGGTIDLMPAVDTVREGRIHGDIVAWVQGPTGATRIMMIDLAWPVLNPIPISNASPAVAVEVGSRFVVWEEINASRDIVAYDLWAGEQVPVAVLAGVNEQSPATYGDYVVWQQNAGGVVSLMARNVAASGDPFLVADPGALVQNPSIDGDFITYESHLHGNFDVFLYRISDGSTYQVTGGAADEILNYVHGNLVAFVEVGATQTDIAVAHLKFVPDDPCAARGGDADGDGICDPDDNCPAAPNSDQADADGDGIGDACDACPSDSLNDGDGDGICATADNCPGTANANQLDDDRDGAGDACDGCPLDSANDADRDGVCAPADNCPYLANADQADSDADGFGDACDDDALQCGPASVLLQGLPRGHIRTVAGSDTPGSSGDGGPATGASLNQPFDVFVDGSGSLFIADSANNRVRRVDGATGVITTVAGSGAAGSGGDGGPATDAQLHDPISVAVDAGGHLFILETAGARIRRVDAATGIITTVAGGGAPGMDDGVAATSVTLLAPGGIAFDPAGSLFLAETGWNRIRRIAAGDDGLVTGAPDETITTVAGTGAFGFAGDGAPARNAELAHPEDLAFDPAGNMVIVDKQNNRIRRVAAGADGEVAGAGDETISTVAGGGAATGDGGAAVNAALDLPRGIAVDRSGNIFISEASALRVRRVDAVTGTTTTAAGGGTALGEDILAAPAQLFTSRGLATDQDGNLFIALIRGKVRAVRLAPEGTPDTTPPVLSVPADIVTNATQPGGAVVAYVATAADDECGIASFSCEPPAGNLFPIGTTQVVCSATDGAGNHHEARFYVTVRGAAEQIVDLLERLRGMPLSPLVKARLTAMLQSVLADPDNVPSVCGFLRVFTIMVQQSAGRGIPQDLARQLVEDATRIRAVLGC